MERIAIVDCRADIETIKNLENLSIKLIPTMKLDNLYDAIATHADIQIHYLGNSVFLCTPETFEHYKTNLPAYFTLIKGEQAVGAQYPYDILYNATSLGGYLVCNKKYTAKEILAKYQENNILNIRQGYSKCNICVVSSNAAITSDDGIAKVLKNHGVDVLKISEGHINLRNLNHGFIGGATGLIREGLLAVNGDINTHPDGDSIKSFCGAHGVDILFLKGGILDDIGTIITNVDI